MIGFSLYFVIANTITGISCRYNKGCIINRDNENILVTCKDLHQQVYML